jgi:cytochrome c-type biogenesis protein CcsB
VSVSQVSLLLLYSAMGVYAMALVAYSWGLAQPARTPAGPSSAALVYPHLAAAIAPPTAAPGARPGPAPRRAWDVARAAPALTLIGWLLHAAAALLRGLSAGRVPWANMFEFSMTSTLIIVGVFLLTQSRLRLAFLGTFVVGLMLVLLGVGTVRYYVGPAPLPPALQSPWLVIHVLMAMTATAYFALGFALSGLVLARSRLDSRARPGGGLLARMAGGIPDAGRLDSLAHRMTVVGFALWTFTLVAGAVWAERAWGRYWGWDTKEVWTFIIWVLYAAYLHARSTRGWSGTRSAWLAVVGFSAVLFNFGVVNVFFKGLHSYSGL